MPAIAAHTTKTKGRPRKIISETNTIPIVKETMKKEPSLTSSMYDHIKEGWERIPLVLTVSYQSYIVALWSYVSLQHTAKVTSPFITVTHAIFSICAGLSLDLVMVGTALRDDDKGPIHLLTLFSAWIASSSIAYAYFIGDPWEKLLHVTWSTMTFLFSWSLAEGKGTNLFQKTKDWLWSK